MCVWSMEMVKSTFKLTQRTFPLAKRSVSSISNNEKEKENCKHKNLMIFSVSIYHQMHKNRLHLLLFMELMQNNVISKCFICICVQEQKKKERGNLKFIISRWKSSIVTVFDERFPIGYTDKLSRKESSF